MYRVVVLQPGYSIMEEDGSMRANGTSSLVVSTEPFEKSIDAGSFTALVALYPKLVTESLADCHFCKKKLKLH